MSYRDQWATLYLAISGRSTFTEDELVRMLRASLLAYWEAPQRPAIQRLSVTLVRDEFGDGVVSSGPFQGVTVQIEGEGGPILTLAKWNLRTRDHTDVTDNILGSTRNSIRASALGPFRSAGLMPFSWSMRKYGEDLQARGNIPPTPALPTEQSAQGVDPSPPTKNTPWKAIITTILGAITMRRML